MEYVIEEKPNTGLDKKITVSSSKDVFDLKEVQMIKNAIQEHLLFLGLDRGNNIRKISLLSIGTSCYTLIDSKSIIRNAITSGSDKVILVHNHPSNSLQPSSEDKYVTSVVKKLLKTFNITLLDHLIVTEENYMSMGQQGIIDKELENEEFKLLDKAFLTEENIRLKQENEELKSQLELKNNNQNFKDSVEEIVTSISDLDDKHYFTVARVMENGKCVELHYNNGKACMEYGTKEDNDIWNNNIDYNVEWFNLELKDDEILSILNSKFDEYFKQNEKLLKERKEEKDMNKYESIIIMKPTLNEDTRKEELNNYKEYLETLSNKPVKVEDLGIRRLAYPIRDNKEGYYAIFNFYGKTENISELERKYRTDENVIKFIVVRHELEREEEQEDSSNLEDEDMEMD